MNYFENISNRSSENLNNRNSVQLKPDTDPMFFFNHANEINDDPLDFQNIITSKSEESKIDDNLYSVVQEPPSYINNIIGRSLGISKLEKSAPIANHNFEKQETNRINLEGDKNERINESPSIDINDTNQIQQNINIFNEGTNDKQKFNKDLEKDTSKTVLHSPDYLPELNSENINPQTESNVLLSTADIESKGHKSQVISHESPNHLIPNHENLPFEYPKEKIKGSKQSPTLSIGKIIVEVTPPIKPDHKKRETRKIVQVIKPPESKPQIYNKVNFGLNQR